LIDFAAAALPSESTDASPFLIDCGYEAVTAQRFNAVSVADINKRRCPNKQTKTALVWPHTTWINPLPPVDRFLFFFSPDSIFSSIATIV